MDKKWTPIIINVALLLIFISVIIPFLIWTQQPSDITIDPPYRPHDINSSFIINVPQIELTSNTQKEIYLGVKKVYQEGNHNYSIITKCISKKGDLLWDSTVSIDAYQISIFPKTQEKINFTLYHDTQVLTYVVQTRNLNEDANCTVTYSNQETGTIYGEENLYIKIKN